MQMKKDSNDAKTGLKRKQEDQDLESEKQLRAVRNMTAEDITGTIAVSAWGEKMKR
jgi:hypothetical protein